MLDIALNLRVGLEKILHAQIAKQLVSAELLDSCKLPVGMNEPDYLCGDYLISENLLQMGWKQGRVIFSDQLLLTSFRYTD